MSATQICIIAAAIFGLNVCAAFLALPSFAAEDGLAYFSTRTLRSGFSEPGFETSLTEPCSFVRHECFEAQLRSGVTRFRVSDDLAGIVECGQSLPDQFVNTKLFGACYLDSPIYRQT